MPGENLSYGLGGFMKYISTLREGERINEIYLCKSKQAAMTKPYDNVILQDKTGTLDAKIWDVGSVGIEEFEAMDYIAITGDITSFQGNLQCSIKRARKVGEGEYDPADYLPVSDKDIDAMYNELMGYIDSVKNQYLSKLLHSFFDNEEFERRFKFHSAAKSVHHGFVGGLLELSTFPENDYTDAGQLLGHIMIGAEWVGDAIRTIDGFPVVLANELKHCILAHHGELEFGSPKKPALVEALALSFADNIDAKMETFRELLVNVPENDLDWQGYNRFMETNFRRTSV